MKCKPIKSRIYENHHLNSDIWKFYKPRDGDVVLSSSLKSGTTWMQYIILNLIFNKDIENIVTYDISPWLDERCINPMGIIDRLEKQTHRRLIKTHLPLDGLPYYENVKYVVIARDPRDVFMSLWNHYQNLTPEVYQDLNYTIPARVGNKLPPCPDSINIFWKMWINKGWFDWESEGYPFWANMRHTQSWWDFKELHNIALFHYSDLKNKIEDEIKKLTKYLDITISDEDIKRIKYGTSFENMRRMSDNFLEKKGRSFRGGSQTFFYKGTNGRWRDALSKHELKCYEKKSFEVMSDACRKWLERG